MSTIHDSIPLKDAMEIWESIIDGQSRLTQDYIRSIYHWGKTIFCDEDEPLSSVFIASGLCESKGDFKRSMNGLFVNEEKVKEDRPIKTFCLPSMEAIILRKGKHAARLAVVPPKK
jgi:hypothetical protein